MKTSYDFDDQIKINLFTLSFPKPIEDTFFEDHFQRSLRHVRIALLLAIFFYGVFGILDAWLVPEVKQLLWFIRYAILLPFITMVFLFSFSSHFKRYMYLSISAVVLLAGLGIVAMILIAPYPGNHSYYAGLILVFIYGYTFFKLRFIWATLVGWAIVIAYEIAAVWLSQTPIPVLINNNFFFLTGNIFGMFACYSIELYSRKNFLQAHLLEAEKEKVKSAKRELEKRVKERTVQLRKANRELMQEIAERKRAEELLHKERETFLSILQKAPFGVVLIDKDGRYLYVNAEFTRVTGYTPQDVPTGRDWFRLAYPDGQYRRKVIESWKQDFSKSGIGRVFKVVCKDGCIRDIEFRPTLLDDDKAIVTLSDITERKRTEENIRQSLHRLEEALYQTVNALAKAAEIRDPYTAGHQERVTRLACAIAKEMDCSEDQIEGIRVAGILHDIGKISVPAEILSKPGPILDMEFNLARTHPQVGYDILKTIDFPWPVAQTVLQHHERMDGSGYPSRLSGENILLEARILAVADVVEAMASHRPYRPALGTEKALKEISENRGVLYDAEVVDTCLELFAKRGFEIELETKDPFSPSNRDIPKSHDSDRKEQKKLD